jgi:hypothetical protein
MLVPTIVGTKGRQDRCDLLPAPKLARKSAQCGAPLGFAIIWGHAALERISDAYRCYQVSEKWIPIHVAEADHPIGLPLPGRSRRSRSGAPHAAGLFQGLLIGVQKPLGRCCDGGGLWLQVSGDHRSNVMVFMDTRARPP